MKEKYEAVIEACSLGYVSEILTGNKLETDFYETYKSVRFEKF